MRLPSNVKSRAPSKKYAARAGGKGGAQAGATRIAYAAMSGMLGSVRDEYTVFLAPQQYAQINQSLDGTQFGGIGLTYEIDDKTNDLQVQDVIPIFRRNRLTSD